jgi:hypothetical protein
VALLRSSEDRSHAGTAEAVPLTPAEAVARPRVCCSSWDQVSVSGARRTLCCVLRAAERDPASAACSVRVIRVSPADASSRRTCSSGYGFSDAAAEEAGPPLWAEAIARSIRAAGSFRSLPRSAALTESVLAA